MKNGIKSIISSKLTIEESGIIVGEFTLSNGYSGGVKFKVANPDDKDSKELFILESYTKTGEVIYTDIKSNIKNDIVFTYGYYTPKEINAGITIYLTDLIDCILGTEDDYNYISYIEIHESKSKYKRVAIYEFVKMLHKECEYVGHVTLNIYESIPVILFKMSNEPIHIFNLLDCNVSKLENSDQRVGYNISKFNGCHMFVHPSQLMSNVVKSNNPKGVDVYIADMYIGCESDRVNRRDVSTWIIGILKNNVNYHSLTWVILKRKMDRDLENIYNTVYYSVEYNTDSIDITIIHDNDTLRYQVKDILLHYNKI